MVRHINKNSKRFEKEMRFREKKNKDNEKTKK